MAQTGRVYDSFHEYDSDRFIPNDHFYVRSSVYLPSSDVDLRTGMLRDDVRRPGRTQALRMEAEKLDEEFGRMDAALQARKNEKGLRISLRSAFVLVMTVAVAFALVLLVQTGTLAQRQRSLKTLNQRMEEIKTANADLQSQITEASDSSTICYAAARDLGMVPASSAQAIHLTAVDTRPNSADAVVSASAQAQGATQAQTEDSGAQQTEVAP
ncbi:MAG TPA: hypothetical protein PKJ47_07565 [Candidatus Limiplasma sp.]|nr:hypothetical protein [Candidatus Limiplasma sp.]